MSCPVETDRETAAVGPTRRLTENQNAVSASEGYQRWASTYDEAPNPLLAREERYLVPLLTHLRQKTILDLACGTGRWLVRLMTQSDGGVGLDCVEAMLRVAGKKQSVAGRLARADCESLPFRNGVFDLVMCSFAIGHIQNVKHFAAGVARVAKPSASVLISDLHPAAYERGWRVGFRDGNGAAEIETWPRPAEEIIQAFHGNGLWCQTQVTLRLEEPEKVIFARAGRLDSFRSACQVPAIQILQFRRFGSSVGIGKESM